MKGLQDQHTLMLGRKLYPQLFIFAPHNVKARWTMEMRCVEINTSKPELTYRCGSILIRGNCYHNKTIEIENANHG